MTKIVFLIASLLFQAINAEEKINLYEDKSIEQICELPLDSADFDIIFQHRLLNNRDEDVIFKLLDGPDGLLKNSAINCLTQTKNRNGLLKIINMIPVSSDTTKTNIYGAIKFVGVEDWKKLIKQKLKIIESDTKSQNVPLREYATGLLSAYEAK